MPASLAHPGSCLLYTSDVYKRQVLQNDEKFSRVDREAVEATNLFAGTDIDLSLIHILLLLQGRSIIAVQTTYLIFNLIKMFFISGYIKKN